MRRAARFAGLAAGLALLAGCEGERLQSMLHPVGPAAEEVARLWWVMFAVYGAVWAVTMLILAFALMRGRAAKDRAPGARFVLIAGVAIPTVILVVMLVYTILITRSISARHYDFRIQVIGHQWWWEVRYPEAGIVDANEIHIAVGSRVRFELESGDVVHSLWVPQLGGKRDLVPGKTNVMMLQSDKAGVFRGQCGEFCGTQHALMAFWVIAHEPDEFEAWLERRRGGAPRQAPGADERLQRGREVFLTVGCATCHRIAGVSEGDLGPDLTLIGSRRSLAAGVYENTEANLAGWIGDPQSMKHDALMPPTYMPPEDLHALVAYLRSLQ